jgi:hypothetical protein
MGFYFIKIFFTKITVGDFCYRLIQNFITRCRWFMRVILATQEDCVSKPACANSPRDPTSIKPITKKRGGGAGEVAQGVCPEFKPQYHKKKKNYHNQTEVHLTDE